MKLGFAPALVALAVLAAGAAGAADDKKREPGAPQSIGAPHYGDTLFHFYQDKTFAALTGLMVSQHFERVQPHDEEAEVLRGGMLLGYGLHREAERVFASLIERNTAPHVRDRAWYFLAKMQHRRQLFAEAEASLARIGAPLKGELENERTLLQAQLLMERQEYAGAATLLDALQTKKAAGPAALYARFNLGVALIRQGGKDNTDRGSALLDQVGQVPGPDEEIRGLRDRANVALGFAALQAKQPREARLALQRVRLNAGQSNKALLGFGWAAAELNDPRLALVPWQELAGRSSGDAAVLEARIAVPYALGEIGNYGQSLKGYEDAASDFESEHKRLDESIAATRAGKFVQGLVATNPSDGLAAFGGIVSLPEMPHAAHLLPMMAGHEFQESFKNLRDLSFLAGNLQQWLANLGAYNDMLANRQKAYAEKLPAVQGSTGLAQFAALTARRDALASELTRATEDKDAVVFATPAEQANLQRIQRGSETLKKAAGEPSVAEDIAGADERLRRAAGALTWQLAQQFSERQWQATKALRAADQQLAEARERNDKLARAQVEEPARHARFAERIAALAARVQGLIPQVAALSSEQQQELQGMAVAELQQQQERLAVYAGQARLAIAQIHDRAQFARRTDEKSVPTR